MPITISGSTGIAGVDGSASTPAVQGTDTNTGIAFPAADTVAVATGATERMRIDSSGNVGIGTSSPQSRLHIVGASAAPLPTGGDGLHLGSFGGYSSIEFAGTTAGYLDFNKGDGTDFLGRIIYDNVNNYFAFYTNGNNERARITSSGDFCVNATTAILGAGNTSTGLGVERAADGATLFVSRGSNAPMYVNRNGDGALVNFNKSGTTEGSISVSGTTVSYNGGHLSRWSQLLNGARDPALLKGTVLSNLDEMCEWLGPDGQPQPNEQLNKIKISDVEGDPNVAGVFVNWDNDDQSNPYDMNIAMTGDMIIRIAQGVVVQKGDLLMSAGDGTAKPQGDDIRRSKTVAKVTSNHVTCTYSDGSYCVPCVLMAC